MKAAKWRDLSDDEVQQRVRELTEELFNLRFQLAMGVAKSPSRLGQARRDLARAQTILAERASARHSPNVGRPPAGAPAGKSAAATAKR